MFMLPYPMLRSPQEARRLREAHKKRLDEAIAQVKPWPQTKWANMVAVDSASFMRHVVTPHLWEGVEVWGGRGQDCVSQAPEGTFRDFGCWRYTVKRLPDRALLDAYQGARRGQVVLHGECLVPGIWRRKRGNQREPRFETSPWMSLTPNEVWTLKPGVRLARGHVVVAGLGLGHQLVQVAHKRTVERITVVEIDQDLVHEVLPRLRRRFPQVDAKLADVDVIVGNAFTELPRLRADVALVDIDEGYGGNTFYVRCKNIGRVWVWGAAQTGGDEW